MPALLRRTAAALAVALGLAAPPALAQDTATPLSAPGASMDPEERALLRSEIRGYLLEHPEVIMEAIEVLERRRRAAENEAEADLVARLAPELFDDGYSFVAGNPDGDVTVVEFIDYQCGFCKRAHPEVRTLIESDPGLRYVVKEFPILGPASRTAAEAALAAMRQDDGRRYLAFNDALMAHDGQLDGDAVWQIADEVGLDVDRLRRDAASDEVASMIDRTYSLARALRIEGTPTFVIGDRLVRGYVPLDRMRATVAEVRAEEG